MTDHSSHTDNLIETDESRAITAERKRAERAARKPVITDQAAVRWLLLVLLAASVYFFYGFIVPVLAAMVIAFASWPIRQRLVPHMGTTWAAIVMVLALVVCIVLPILMGVLYAIHEVRGWSMWLMEVNTTGAPTPEWMQELPFFGAQIDERWAEFLGRPGGVSALIQLVTGSNIMNIYRGVLSAGYYSFHLFLNLVFVLVALFVFYHDGDKIVAQIGRVGRRLLPERWDRLSSVAPMTVSSTVTGMTLIAIGEGIILGLAYWVAGVPAPATFGLITGFLALIPGGAPLAFTTISLYLVASGSPIAGVGLFVWGTVELFIVDKTIRPWLVGGPVRLPFLLTFFGLIGGIKTMGIVGLFVGPVLMALLMTIWREWQREIRAPHERAEDLDPH